MKRNPEGLLMEISSMFATIRGAKGEEYAAIVEHVFNQHNVFIMWYNSVSPCIDTLDIQRLSETLTRRFITIAICLYLRKNVEVEGPRATIARANSMRADIKKDIDMLFMKQAEYSEEEF